MLSTLRRVVQEVGAAQDLKAVMTVIVRSVKAAIRADICSIYLYNSTKGHFKLMASEGWDLPTDANTGHIFSYDDGLVGLVGQREEPINIKSSSNLAQLSDGKKVSGIGSYKSFLGVPIIHHRNLLGVLVVQNKASRLFDETEESFLVTMSAQLAGFIAHAEATGLLSVSKETDEHVVWFNGVTAASGVAIGTSVIISTPADFAAITDFQKTLNIEKECKKFQEALQSVRQDVHYLLEKSLEHMKAEEHSLFQAYIRMWDDNALPQEVEKIIREMSLKVESALKQVVFEHIRHFKMMEDPYLRERATDVEDMGRRVLAVLQKSAPTGFDYPDSTIVVGEELTLGMLADIPREKLAGIVSVGGSYTAHVAILARAIGVPAVVGAVDLPYLKLDKRQIIVDGNLGKVYTSPSRKLLNYYTALRREEQTFSKGLAGIQSAPCITPDGHQVSLLANIGLMTDVSRDLENAAEGVGLYRTESLFIAHSCFPGEAEQAAFYRTRLLAFHPRKVTARTLDIGGDKSLSYFPIKEDNPALGWRGIRVTLDHPELFLVQVRAMLKASLGLDNLKIMFPMVSSLEEVDAALCLLNRAFDEVVAEGHSVVFPETGVMIETPAAVYQASEYAKIVDFLSVGSNDLMQYMLAVDRNNPRVSGLCYGLHPAMIRALKSVVLQGHAEKKPVGICGEIAGDPICAVLLMAMGFDSLSMSPINLPKVKWTLRNIKYTQAREILQAVSQSHDCKIISEKIASSLRDIGLGKIVATQAVD